MADIFLSHNSADNEAADQIKSWLERDRASWSVFLDKHPHEGILAGQGWQDRLRSELQSCRLVLAIITPEWLDSRWCFTEAVIATFRGKDFVGVVPGALAESALDVAPPIVNERQRLRLDLNTGDGWQELLYALDRSGLDPSQWFPIPPGVGPYPGFVAFEEKDAGVFFGRDEEITHYLDELALLRAPDRAQALVISGGSGSGKSSLLKAGLIPRLRRQPEWVVIPPFDPSREPVHALLAAIRTTAQDLKVELEFPLSPPATIEGLTELLQNSLRTIEEQTNAWLMLPLDQAEVLLAGSPAGTYTDSSLLIDSVGELLACRTRKLVAVFTIRTEFMPALERKLPPAVRLNDQSLRPLIALSEIIEKPAARFGIELEAGLTGRMVEDTRGADALPLLAYTLHEIHERYSADKLLTIVEYEQLGGVEGAIEKKLHEALSDPEPAPQEFQAFRRCFVRQLVRVDENAVEGERYLRTTVAHDAVPDAAVRLVDRLRQARLLVGNEDGSVGIAHERLIQDWQKMPLKTWLDNDSDDRKHIDNLRAIHATYQNGGPLLTAKPLLDAKEFLERELSFADDEPALAQFISESIVAEQSQRRRQQWVFRGAIVASVIFLCVATGAIMFYRQAQQQTEIAERERDRAEEQTRLAQDTARESTAESTLPTDPTRAVLALLEVEAESPRSVSLLNQARAQLLTIREFRGHQGRLHRARFSPNGERIVTASGDKTARIWHIDGTHRPVVLTPASKNGIRDVRWSPNAQTIATATNDGPLRVHDAQSGDMIETYKHWQRVEGIALAPNGHHALSITANAVGLWDTSTRNWTEIKKLAPGHDWPKSRLFSHDGTQFLTYNRINSKGTVKLWQAKNGEPVTKGHIISSADFPASDACRANPSQCSNGSRQLEMASFSPSGAKLVTASRDGTARIWNTSGVGTPITLQHDNGVREASFSPDGMMILTVTTDGIPHLWSTNGSEESVALNGHNKRFGNSYGLRAVIGPKSERVVDAASPDGTATLWHMEKEMGGTEKPFVRVSTSQSLRGHLTQIIDFEFSPDGERIVTASGDQTARLWRTESLGTLYHYAPLQSAQFSPDDLGSIIMTVSDDHTVRLWDHQSQTLFAILRHDGKVNQAVFDKAGKRIATASQDGQGGRVQVWRIDDLKREGQTNVAESPPPLFDANTTTAIHSVDFDPTGDQIVTGDAAERVQLWRLGEDAKLIEEQVLPPDLKQSRGCMRRGCNPGVDFKLHVAFSPGGNMIVRSTADYCGAVIWERKLEAWLPAPHLCHRSGVLSSSFSTDGNVKVLTTTGFAAQTKIWEPASSSEPWQVTILEGPYGGPVAAFSPTGSQVVSGYADGDVWVFDHPFEEVSLRLTGHRAEILDVNYSADGKRIVSASADQTARVWHAHHNAEPIELRGHQDKVVTAVFSPDGSQVLTASKDGTARLWLLSLRKLQTEVQQETQMCLDTTFRNTRLGEPLEEARAAYQACELAMGRCPPESELLSDTALQESLGKYRPWLQDRLFRGKPLEVVLKRRDQCDISPATQRFDK